MRAETLIDQTVTHFPTYARSEIAIMPVEKGGSDRKFYRVRITDQHSLILVKYNSQREENRHYVEIARFLARLGVRAPRIYFHDAAECLIWMEDLGERDLWSYRTESWPVRRGLYLAA